MYYVYFIITPGSEPDSFVRYPNQQCGNYIKFGRTTSPLNTDQGRNGYRPHLPDYGICAVMQVDDHHGTQLDTTLRHLLAQYLGCAVTGTTEWFSVQTHAAWKLAKYLTKYWDGQTITDANYPLLSAGIIRHLT